MGLYSGGRESGWQVELLDQVDAKAWDYAGLLDTENTFARIWNDTDPELARREFESDCESLIEQAGYNEALVDSMFKVWVEGIEEYLESKGDG